MPPANPSSKATWEAMLVELESINNKMDAIPALLAQLVIANEFTKYDLESSYGSNPTIDDIADGPPFP